MRKLITYNKSQYDLLISGLKDAGYELFSLFEFNGSDCVAELSSTGNFVVDISSLMGLLPSEPQTTAKFELLVHQMPANTYFIGDESIVAKKAYQLRTVFDNIKNCGIEIAGEHKKTEETKRTLVSISEQELKQVLTALDHELIGQLQFKQAFNSESRIFRLFNALDEQAILSILLLGPSGVGKTEVARILCEAIAPNQPLPKVNLGNYSSKDSLNSLIGSPRGYMGSEEGELIRKIDSSNAGILLVDEFEKAEPAVWNFFLDLLETGTFTDSQGAEHSLCGFVVIFTTNCPRKKLHDTFPAELLSRFSLKAHFSQLDIKDKKLFVERYVTKIIEKYETIPSQNLPMLPENILERAQREIDVELTDNIRILKNITKTWIGKLIEEAIQR